jgi:hypothetical protein
MSMSKPQRVTVKVESGDVSQDSRAFAVLKERIEQRCPVEVVEVREDAQLILALDGHLPSEGFCIAQVGHAIRVSGGSALGLLYGVGKFLRTSAYNDGFVPTSWRGTSVPHGSLRGMYFANHFHNWYHVASDEEIARYIEDITLWGVNALMGIYPFINLQGWDDPEAGPAMDQVRRLFRAAKNTGLETTIGLGNVLFNSTPQEVRATPLPDLLGRHGNSGAMVCPSLPAGRELILRTTAELLERLKDVGVDYLCLWPYDEGGCGCERCRPWGANGFIRMAHDIAATARTILPDVKIVLSTWTFDTPLEGEWQGLSDALAYGNGWADYILADAHEDFPRYPLDEGVPGNLPLINFPEISMWGNWPWGGCGAHTLPNRLQRLWDQAKHVLQGGFPYSEGIYEDISKAIVSQFYWDPDCSAQSTLREYAAYEFSPEVVDDVLALIEILEMSASRHYMQQPVDEAVAAGARRAAMLAEAIHARLPLWARQSWRWEILYLRAILDRERFAGAGLETPIADAALLRLCEIYHCQVETDDPYHHRVRPPYRLALSRHGMC